MQIDIPAKNINAVQLNTSRMFLDSAYKSSLNNASFATPIPATVINAVEAGLKP